MNILGRDDKLQLLEQLLQNDAQNIGEKQQGDIQQIIALNEASPPNSKNHKLKYQLLIHTAIPHDQILKDLNIYLQQSTFKEQFSVSSVKPHESEKNVYIVDCSCKSDSLNFKILLLQLKPHGISVLKLIEKGRQAIVDQRFYQDVLLKQAACDFPK